MADRGAWGDPYARTLPPFLLLVVCVRFCVCCRRAPSERISAGARRWAGWGAQHNFGVGFMRQDSTPSRWPPQAALAAPPSTSCVFSPPATSSLATFVAPRRKFAAGPGPALRRASTAPHRSLPGRSYPRRPPGHGPVHSLHPYGSDSVDSSLSTRLMTGTANDVTLKDGIVGTPTGMPAEPERKKKKRSGRRKNVALNRAKARGIIPRGEGPFQYHEEITLRIDGLTNLGLGVGRVPLPAAPSSQSAIAPLEAPLNQPGSGRGYVIMVPSVMPGELVRARVWQNRTSYSLADLVEILEPHPDRITPPCPYFSECGGCQYQFAELTTQRTWKHDHVVEVLQKLGGIENPQVDNVVGTHHAYGYRSKLTPHHGKPDPVTGEVGPIGFQRAEGRGQNLIDVENCLIATPAINGRLATLRQQVQADAKKEVAAATEAASAGVSRKKARGATLLLRDTRDGVAIDPREEVYEHVKGRTFELTFKFKAGEFFQNNPYVLPLMVDHVLDQATTPLLGSERTPKYLIDAYCGGGLFCLAASSLFDRCVGIEISELNIESAKINAGLNRIKNCDFVAGTAEDIFKAVQVQPLAKDEPQTAGWEDRGGEEGCVEHGGFDRGSTVVVIDPPRKGCSTEFLSQLLDFAPARVVYVSCDPATQARDVKIVLETGHYAIANATPFDLFPNTRHIESVITLDRL